MSREAFEKWFDKNEIHGGFVSKRDFDAGWQACEAHMQAEIAKRDAVIAEIKNLAKEYIAWTDSLSMSYEAGDAMDNLKDALALTPENVRMVEVGEVGSIAICKGTPRQVTYLRKNTRTGTKLYTLVKDGE